MFNRRTALLSVLLSAAIAPSCSNTQETALSTTTATAITPADEDVATVIPLQDPKKGKLLFKDNFSGTLENYTIETPASPNSTVSIQNRKLVIDVDGGATVWLNQKLSGNIQIEYTRKVVMEGGKNDRLSDLNQFWMATDPAKPDHLFTRTGVFKEYDNVRMYYVGVGGNTNTTTRFRKYTGTGDRVLHHDLQDKEHLLEPNKVYRLKTIVYNGTTRFFVDGKEYFAFQDPEPLTEGYFGFRTTESRHEIDDLEIYALE